jgi:hypothetical protein
VRVLYGVLAGAGFGALTSVVNNVPGMLGEVGLPRDEQGVATWIAEYFSKMLDSGWAWAALAVAAGWLAATRAGPLRAALIGALTGTLALLAATLAYYGTDTLFAIDIYWSTSGYWLAGSVLFGPPLGAVGSAVRRPGPVGLLAGLTVPVGAAANMVLFPIWPGLPGESPSAGWAQLSVLVAAAAGTALVVVRYARGVASSRPTSA